MAKSLCEASNFYTLKTGDHLAFDPMTSRGYSKRLNIS